MSGLRLRPRDRPDTGAERRRGPARGDEAGPRYDGVLAEHRGLCRGARGCGRRGRDAAAARRLSQFRVRRGSRLRPPEGAILLRPGAREPDRRGRGDRPGPAPPLRARAEARRGLCRRRRHIDPARRDIDRPVRAAPTRPAPSASSSSLHALGRRARIVATPPGVLHLKTACALVDEETVIADAGAGGRRLLRRLRRADHADRRGGSGEPDPGERPVLIAADYPRTTEMLAAPGLRAGPARRGRDREDRRRPVVHVDKLAIVGRDLGLRRMDGLWR